MTSLYNWFLMTCEVHSCRKRHTSLTICILLKIEIITIWDTYQNRFYLQSYFRMIIEWIRSLWNFLKYIYMFNIFRNSSQCRVYLHIYVKLFAVSHNHVIPLLHHKSSANSRRLYEFLRPRKVLHEFLRWGVEMKSTLPAEYFTLSSSWFHGFLNGYNRNLCPWMEKWFRRSRKNIVICRRR